MQNFLITKKTSLIPSEKQWLIYIYFIHVLYCGYNDCRKAESQTDVGIQQHLSYSCQKLREKFSSKDLHIIYFII